MNRLNIFLIILISFKLMGCNGSDNTENVPVSNNGPVQSNDTIPETETETDPIVYNFPTPCQTDCINPQALTKSGTIEGLFNENGLSVFKGIPYAEPPINDLRFRSPRKKQVWEDHIRPAKEFSASCIRMPSILSDLFNDRSDGQSEDCLYLNVWTPAVDNKKRPVLVWVHGGTLMSGSAANTLYDGGNLAKSGDAVVVSMNYRLGILGGLSHPNLTDPTTGMSGNWHAQDVLAALKWIKNNIDQFGGDPEQITLFGESAGSWLVTSLIASPLSNGYINKAISQSGVLSLRSSEIAKKSTEDLFNLIKVGCDEVELNCLQSLNLKQIKLLQLIPNLNNILMVEDGIMFPDNMKNLLQSGEAADVELIIGANQNEIPLPLMMGGSLLLSPIILPTHKNYTKLIEKVFKLGRDEDGNRHAKIIWDSYRDKYGKLKSPSYLISKLGNDLIFNAPVERYARFFQQGGGSVHKYKFDVKPLLHGKYDLNLGAFHGSELPLVFGNLDLEVKLPLIKTTGFQKDREMVETSELMQNYWVKFARGDSLMTTEVPWFQYFDVSTQQMEFSRSGSRSHETDDDIYRAWENSGLDFLTTDALYNRILSKTISDDIIE